MATEILPYVRQHGKTQAYVETLARQILDGLDVAALPPDATRNERKHSHRADVVVIGRDARDLVDRANAEARRQRGGAA